MDQSAPNEEVKREGTSAKKESKRGNIFGTKSKSPNRDQVTSKFFKKSMDKYKLIGDNMVKDFRSSLGEGEQKIFDKREQDLELQ
jgi:hypothetical protein